MKLTSEQVAAMLDAVIDAYMDGLDPMDDTFAIKSVEAEKIRGMMLFELEMK